MSRRRSLATLYATQAERNAAPTVQAPDGAARSDADRVWSCTRKLRYATRQDAEAHVRGVLRKICRRLRKPGYVPTEGDRPVHAYRCRYCPCWHVGRVPGSAPLTLEEATRE